MGILIVSTNIPSSAVLAMSYCINPTCPAPDKNSLTTNFCISCGAKILLKDRYRALKLLGQGGFGKTFKAVDEDQPRKPLCVVKQFAFSNNHPETRQIALKLFYEEAQHLEALGKHDQIPELLAYFDVEGQPYLVQQFIDGQDLEQELATVGTFNQAKIRELLESLLPVLDFLHHQSPPVIHRDIKPANIIRRRSDGGLVLVDFGAAKQATQSMLAKTGTAIGSAEFVAPEQARRKPVFASDIYSLGVTCIYLLTQVSPFDLFDMNQDAWVWRDYLVDNPVDEKLGKVLDKMIANVLPQRYQSAAKVLQALGIENKSPSSSHSFQHRSQQMNAEDYFDRGVVKEDELNDFAGALADYNKAIELDPEYMDAYCNRGLLKYSELDDIYGALDDFDKAIDIDPSDAINYYYRGLLKHNEINDIYGALDDYDKAIDIDPSDADFYFNRGLLKYNEMNDVHGAFIDFNKAIDLDQKHANSYYFCGILKYQDLNDISGALIDFNQAILLDPNDANFYHLRGILKDEKLKDVTGALTDFNKAIDIDLTYDSSYYWRGMLKYTDLNDVAGALTDYNKSIELNPDDAYVYNHRGILKHNELNDLSGALADYNKAIELNRNDGDFYSNRGMLKCNELNNISVAIQDFRQSACLYLEQGKTEDFENAIGQLKELGANFYSVPYKMKK
ncbi:MAG: tetratricopeptide repeat protein [Chamaesiphon sp.]|nr:tetratricopeptide repeat protein [Chamaesiphon sp.]